MCSNSLLSFVGVRSCNKVQHIFFIKTDWRDNECEASLQLHSVESEMPAGSAVCLQLCLYINCMIFLCVWLLSLVSFTHAQTLCALLLSHSVSRQYVQYVSDKIVLISIMVMSLSRLVSSFLFYSTHDDHDDNICKDDNNDDDDDD